MAKLAAVPEDTAPAVVPGPEPDPERARQLTRAKVLITVGGVTALLAWRFTAHAPGRTLDGHLFWFVLWDALLCALILWAWTGFAHRNWRGRSRHHWGRGRDAWAARRDRPRGPGPAGTNAQDPAPDGTALAVAPRHARPPAVPRPAAGGVWAGPVSALDVDGENGQEVLARLREAARGERRYADAIDGLHEHLTTDRGYETSALSRLADAADAHRDAAGALDLARQQVADHYSHLLEAADDGIKGPHDGHEFEDD